MFRFRPKKRNGNVIAFIVCLKANALLLLFISFILMGTCVNFKQVL